MCVASRYPQSPLGRPHIMWQLANQGRLVKLLHQFIWLQFHLWIYQDGEDESLTMLQRLGAGNTVQLKRTADVHNLSWPVSLKSDTVCGNTQNSPLLFFVFWKLINAFMSISMASACMFCLASRAQYLLCYSGFVFHYSCRQAEIGIQCEESVFFVVAS